MEAIFALCFGTRSTAVDTAVQRHGAHSAQAEAAEAELRPVVERFAKDVDSVDPCGPSPIQIHLPQLRRLTPEWLRLSFELKRDPQVTRHV